MLFSRSFPGGFLGGLSLALLACTEPNPQFEIPEDAKVGCYLGQRQCNGQVTEVCAPQGEGAAFVVDRECPGGTSCQAGVCIPANTPCTSACEGKQVCSIFVDPQQSKTLANFCTDPVGNIPGQMPCTSSVQCQSGFCVGRGNDLNCYQACERTKDCSLSQGYKCLRLTVTISGVQGQVNGCLKY